MFTRSHLALAALAAWLVAYLLVRLATRDRKVRPSAEVLAGPAAGSSVGPPATGGERPAVTGLLAGRPWTDWHAATMPRLASRGHRRGEPGTGPPIRDRQRTWA